MSTFLLSAFLSLASGPVNAVVDRSHATVDDAIILTVMVDDLRAREPELPRIPGARVTRQGRTRASQVINGERTDTVAYRFAVYPKSTGTLRIPPIPVRIGTRLYRTEPIEIKVMGSDSPVGLRPFFANSSVSNPSPYRSQQIIYTLQLFAELLDIKCNSIDWPDFDEFIVEDVGQRRFETVRDGRRFRVTEFRKALYPLEPGRVEVPPAQLECTVTYPTTRGVVPGGGFGRLLGNRRVENKLFKSNAVSLRVKALPTPPPEFSNVVGKVEVNATLSERRLVAGSSATQTLYVKSDGNLRGFAPRRPDLDGVKIYDDQVTVQVTDKGSHLTSLFEMNRAFVPVRDGSIAIPPFELTYFDPERGRYETARSPRFTLLVSPNPDQESLRLVDGVQAQSKAPVAVANTTLMPYAASPVLGLRSPPSWLVALAALFPPLVLAGLTLRDRRRSKRPKSSIGKLLAELHGLDDAEQVEHVLRKVLARFGDEFRAVTAGELKRSLTSRGVDQDDSDGAARWLQWAEASRFGGSRESPPSSLKELSSLLVRVDRVLGGRDGQ